MIILFICTTMKLQHFATDENGLKSMEARFIRNIEQLHDNEIYLIMHDILQPQPIACVNWAEYDYAPQVSVRVAHSDEALAIMFEVEEEHLLAANTEDNGSVWEDSCVEFFVKNPNGEGYFNFEMNCIGTLLAAFRRARNDADMFSAEKLAAVRRICSLEHKQLDKAEGGRWWAIEVIPFSLLGLDSAPESLQANFYKCGDKCRRMHFLSWSPIALEQPNIHCPEFFGRVELI